jgi:phosphoadenosine phosphosulfate reductase
MSGGSILVGLSGGKDSLVTLDLCVRTFTKVEAFFMYLCRGIRCVEEPAELAAKRAGVKLHFVPHWDLARIRKYGVLGIHTKDAVNLPELKMRDIERYLTKTTGIGWFAYGERGTDSMTRRLHHRKVDGIHDRGIGEGKLAPIWDWIDSDVYGYMRARKIPTPPKFGQDGRMSGLTLVTPCLRWLRDNHPDDWATLLKSFPFAEAQLFP